MLLAALNCPGLHPGYNTSRPRLYLTPLCTQPFARLTLLAYAFENLEIS